MLSQRENILGTILVLEAVISPILLTGDHIISLDRGYGPFCIPRAKTCL